MQNGDSEFRMSSELLMMIGVLVALVSLPLSAYLLWSDHRQLAWIALICIFTGVTPVISLPVGVGFLVYAVTENQTYAIVGGIAALLCAFVLPRLIEEVWPVSKTQAEGINDETQGRSWGKKAVVAGVVTLAVFGAFSLYREWSDRNDTGTEVVIADTASTSEPENPVETQLSSSPTRVRPTSTTDEPCDAVLEWGDRNRERGNELATHTAILESAGDTPPKVSDLIRARDAARAYAMDQRNSNPPSIAIGTNDLLVKMAEANADILDAIITGDQAQAIALATQGSELMRESQAAEEELILACDL